MSKSRKESLAQYVRRIVKQKGLKLREIEEKSGGEITNGYISSIMSGNVTNLTVEKIAALAVGMGVDGREIFSAAYGEPTHLKGAPRSSDRMDAMVLLETMQSVVFNPQLMDILQELMHLPSERQAKVLRYVKDLSESERKSKRKRRLT